MEAGERGLQVVGVEQIATKNNLTVRVRVYLRRFDGRMYTFDADQGVWDMEALWVPDKPIGIVNDGLPR